jgi:hypothetical protein
VRNTIRPSRNTLIFEDPPFFLKVPSTFAVDLFGLAAGSLEFRFSFGVETGVIAIHKLLRFLVLNEVPFRISGWVADMPSRICKYIFVLMPPAKQSFGANECVLKSIDQCLFPIRKYNTWFRDMFFKKKLLYLRDSPSKMFLLLTREHCKSNWNRLIRTGYANNVE